MNENQDAIKAAAKRMCDSFKTQGIELKHTAMLEALAVGFGLENWRTMKAVIDAPRIRSKKAAPVLKAPALGQWQEWIVSAIYRDNQQQYGQGFDGRTALEAAVNGMFDRLADFGNEIDVIDVKDLDGKSHFSPSIVGELQLLTNRAALEAVRSVFKGFSFKDGSTQNQRLALAWLENLLDSYEFNFDYLTDWSVLEEAVSDNVARIGPQPGVHEGYALSPTEALALLCDMGEEALGGIVKLEAKDENKALAFYQVRAMCHHFGDVLDNEENGDMVLLKFELDGHGRN